MAKGDNTGRNLIVVAYDNKKAKNKEGQKEGAGQFLDIHVDARDEKLSKNQTNLHISSQRDGDRYDNDVFYQESQLDAIKEAAGDNVTDLLDKEGGKVGSVYGIKGNIVNLARDENGRKAIVNTKALEASDFQVDETTMAAQFTSMRERGEAYRAAVAAKAAEAEAPEQSVEAEAEEPAFG